MKASEVETSGHANIANMAFCYHQTCMKTAPWSTSRFIFLILAIP